MAVPTKLVIDGEQLLAINHEFGRNRHLLGLDAPTTLAQVRTSQHAHGASIIAIKKTGDRWESIASPANRRIHANTPMSFSGPVAGHALLKNQADNTPKGTFANCSNGRLNNWRRFPSVCCLPGSSVGRVRRLVR